MFLRPFGQKELKRSIIFLNKLKWLLIALILIKICSFSVHSFGFGLLYISHIATDACKYKLTRLNYNLYY